MGCSDRLRKMAFVGDREGLSCRGLDSVSSADGSFPLPRPRPAPEAGESSAPHALKGLYAAPSGAEEEPSPGVWIGVTKPPPLPWLTRPETLLACCLGNAPPWPRPAGNWLREGSSSSSSSSCCCSPSFLGGLPMALLLLPPEGIDPRPLPVPDENGELHTTVEEE